MTDLPNLTAKLEHMLINLLGQTSPNSLSDVHAAIEAIIGPPGADGRSLPELLSGVRDSVQALRGDDNTTLSSLLRTDEYVSAQIQLNSKLTDLKEQLDYVQAALGAVPYNSLELASVRGLLYGILNALRQSTAGPMPGGVQGRASSGNTVVGGRRYATFSPPITGISVLANRYDLEAVGGWSGWQVYVQTTAPRVQLNTAEDSPNAWLDLVGTGTYNFSVDVAYPIVAYIRNTATPPNEPLLLWSGTEQTWFTGTYRPDQGPIYAWEAIPVWADRLQIQIETTGCNGGYNLWTEAIGLAGNYNGGCRTEVLTLPMGARYIEFYSGGAGQVASGAIYALPPGYVVP